MFGLFGDPFFGYSPFHRFGLSSHDFHILNQLQDLFEDSSDDEESTEEKPKSKSSDKEEKSNGNNSKSYQKFSQIRSSYFNGPSLIEETRERTCDGSTGSVKETTTRRIGDKWCTIEEETNKNGEKVTREKWHNVAENEVEKFKSKWEKHRGQFGFEHLSLTGPNDNKKEEKDQDQ
ncbi:cysteine protease [Histomonas meleagridis]|uniref:cysteine protease n=1 Tax=Histomonas meleagridis TaxID=135588 RepID=UPI003559EB44|nr:cysteine protease [Histomonas meleagridis]